MSTAALLALVLINPVGGPVARAFDLGANPFEGGRHRGADLAAAPGAPVRAACGGPVVVAGRVGASGRLVTVRCGPWRVTHMPLAAIAVGRGAVVEPRDRLGTLARSPHHAGLHLGVRRDGTRFGYADPLRFMSAADRTPPVPLGRAPRGSRPRAGPPRPRVAPRPPVAPPLIHPRRRAAPRLVHAPRHPGTPSRGAAPRSPTRAPARSARLAPWPAWAGLGLVLAGAGVRWRGGRERRRRGPSRSAAGQPARGSAGPVP